MSASTEAHAGVHQRGPDAPWRPTYGIRGYVRDQLHPLDIARWQHLVSWYDVCGYDAVYGYASMASILNISRTALLTLVRRKGLPVEHAAQHTGFQDNAKVRCALSQLIRLAEVHLGWPLRNLRPSATGDLHV